MVPDQIRQLVTETREAQGLSPTVTDPASLSRISELVSLAGGMDTRKTAAHSVAGDLAPQETEIRSSVAVGSQKGGRYSGSDRKAVGAMKADHLSDAEGRELVRGCPDGNALRREHPRQVGDGLTPVREDASGFVSLPHSSPPRRAGS